MVGIVGSPNLTISALHAGAGSIQEASRELFRVIPEVSVEHLALTLVGLFIVSFGLFSGFIKEKLYVGEAIIATVIGIIFSGYVGGVFSPRSWAEGVAFDDITLELTRIVIALSVFAVGVELPKAYVVRHWRSLSILLGPVMLFGWILSGALIYAIIPGLDFLSALVVAAGLSPTDPILAASVVGKGKFAQDHVPSHIRHLLQAESGANDGAAFPFLYLALFLLLRENHSSGEAVGYWILLVILYQIILGITIGTVVGIAARKLLKYSKRRKLIDRESMVAMYVALAFFVTGLTTLAGSDDLLAAFAAGSAFAWDDWFTESIEESNFSSIIDLLVNSTIFIYLGASMPFSSWNDATLTLTPWRLVLLAIAILALKRLPVIFLLHRFIPDIKTRREAIFSGHFGPIGIGAIFISTLATSKLPTPNIPPETSLDLLALTIQPITYFLVLSSVLVHGLTISFFSLGRRVHSRVQSISRTFTQASVGPGEEPSWMSRVKKITLGENIIINRDDDDDATEDLAEKGDLSKIDLKESRESENGEKGEEEENTTDTGLLAMFGAPSSGNSSSNTAAGSSSSSVDKKVKEDKDKDNEGEGEGELEGNVNNDNDEHPSHNVLGDKKEDRDHHVDLKDEDENQEDEKKSIKIQKKKNNNREKIKVKDYGIESDGEVSGKEERYCRSDEITSWDEGRQIVIDSKDGEEVEVIDLHPTPSIAEKAIEHPHQKLISIPTSTISKEKLSLQSEGSPLKPTDENAVKRFMKRRGSIAQAAVALIKNDDGLTKEEREARRADKLARDAWCRKEKHYIDREDSNEVKKKGAQEWREGSKIITVRSDEDIDVREMTIEEREARAAKHLAALKLLGRPLEKVEAELLKLTKSRSNESESNQSNRNRSSSVDKGKGKSKDSTVLEEKEEEEEEVVVPKKPSGLGLTKTKTIRLEDDDDEEEEDQEWQDEPTSPLPTSPSRPQPLPRANSRVRAMRDLIFHPNRDRSPDKLSPSTGGAGGAGSRGRLNQIEPSPGDSRSSSPGRASIRFLVGDKPNRDLTSSNNGRPRSLKGVGTGLGVKRVPTK